MDGRNVFCFALCIFSTFFLAPSLAQAKDLIFFQDTCSTAQRITLDVSPDAVAYVGPPPPAGQRLCLLDRTRLLMCINLDAPIDTVAPNSCALGNLLVCPAVKHISYGLGCAAGSSAPYTTVPEGKKLCVANNASVALDACADVTSPWIGNSLTKGILRGAQDMVTETSGQIAKQAAMDRKATMEAKQNLSTVVEELMGEEAKMAVVEEIKSQNDKTKKEELLKTFSPLPVGESWYLCWFNNGAIESCVATSVDEPWVPLPYTGFSGIYVVPEDSNKTIGYVAGRVTLEGLKSALSSALQFFSNAFFR